MQRDMELAIELLKWVEVNLVEGGHALGLGYGDAQTNSGLDAEFRAYVEDLGWTKSEADQHMVMLLQGGILGGHVAPVMGGIAFVRICELPWTTRDFLDSLRVNSSVKEKVIEHARKGVPWATLLPMAQHWLTQMLINNPTPPPGI